MGMGLGQIGSVIPALKAANISSNKFYLAKEREAVMRRPDGNVPAITNEGRPLSGSIEFKNVTFAYPSNPEKTVLSNVSFSIPKGSSLAIVGPSGSGKSTVISLLERFYDYDSGSIILDGAHKINNLDVSYLRSSIGLVSQMPLLFDSSIAENIRGGKQDATMEDIVCAAKQANAHGFIVNLENGYETNVGELGGRLSGGQ